MSTRSDESDALLEVVVLHARDAEAAAAGGATRLHLARLADDQTFAVEPGDVSAVVRASDVPVWVTLRLTDGFTTQGGEFRRLAGLAGDYLSLGVEGFVFGFLTPDLEIDADTTAALADACQAPWEFDRAFDHALDPSRAWRSLRDLPGLSGVHTSGALSGLQHGFDDLMELCATYDDLAPRVVACDGITAEQVPWLADSGVRGVRLGPEVRAQGSWTKAHVEPSFVRSWRLLLDDTLCRRRRTV